MKERNLIGEKFGRLTVTDFGSPINKKPRWKCLCSCGKIKEIREYSLLKGNTKSCGCLAIDKTRERSTTHNLTNSSIYKVFSRMKDRCLYIKHPQYKDYGGRGITICEEWLSSPLSFYNWAINNGYRKGLSIDRIDNDGNYEPDNCRWVTMSIQNNNQRSNVFIDHNGERLTLAQAAKKSGINEPTLRHRVDAGWSNEEIFGYKKHKITFPNRKRSGRNTYLITNLLTNETIKVKGTENVEKVTGCDRRNVYSFIKLYKGVYKKEYLIEKVKE